MIKQHESIASAAKEIGVDKSCIRDAAKGRQKHAGGFTWKYVDDLPADKMTFARLPSAARQLFLALLFQIWYNPYAAH